MIFISTICTLIGRKSLQEEGEGDASSKSEVFAAAATLLFWLFWVLLQTGRADLVTGFG